MHLSLEEIRKNKLKQLNFNPYQQKRFFRNTNIKCIIDSFSFFKKEELTKLNQKVRIAGRLLRMRDFGRLIFSILADQTGSIQLKIIDKKDFLELDLGDIIGLEGKVCKTDKGELSIDVEKFILLSKCLKPLPDTHYGFIDIEQRLSKRYLDFMMNPENRNVLIVRHKIVQNIRHFLDKKNYIEIETPILVDSPSGALAKPFSTRHNKMRKNFYLRIATEIHLKMLLVGGFEKVYEIGRIFRNEGIDSRHNPEFTSIEIYNAYENSQYMINLTEELFHFLVSNVLKKNKIRFNFHTIDLSLSFHRISMIDSVKKYCGVDFGLIGNDLEKALEIAHLHNIKLKDFQYSIGHILLSFFEKYVEKNLIEPTFVYDLPLIVSPLAKAADKNSTIIAERFELYISGVEFANGYSELNDPFEQRKRFEEQVKQKASGNEEISDFDQAFIEALEYGMPPATGLGIGIERLIMLFTEKDNIREVMAFSQIK